MASFTNTPKLSDRFAKALQFAAEAHNFQIRKQGEIPYISHLMSVSALVLEAGGNEDEAVAALLHDYIEDIDNTSDASNYIEHHFGFIVLLMVGRLSANSHEEYVSNISMATESVKLISCADKLHNLRGYGTTGRSLWSEKQAQFYAQLMPIYEGCDRIPRHWINEMKLLLRFLQEI